ncbi:MAG: hypothetical protein WAK03_10940 [Methylocystis sp.]|jgi:type II secretory pathway pseudopilin PulG
MRDLVKTRFARRRPGSLHRRVGGFVLIEALAAFAILTMSLAALMNGVFGAVLNDDRADFMLRATRIARSELDAIGVESPPRPGVTQGKSDDGLIFVLTVDFAPMPPQNNPQAPKIIAYSAHIDVTRTGEMTGKTLTLGFDTFKASVIRETIK